MELAVSMCVSAAREESDGNGQIVLLQVLGCRCDTAAVHWSYRMLRLEGRRLRLR